MEKCHGSHAKTVWKMLRAPWQKGDHGKKTPWANVMGSRGKKGHDNPKRNPFRAAWCFITKNQHDSSPVRLCRSCLRLFGDLRKNTPLEFGNIYLADFVIFNDFRAPQALCGRVAPASGASAPSKKHSRGFLEYVSGGFCNFLTMSGSNKC